MPSYRKDSIWHAHYSTNCMFLYGWHLHSERLSNPLPLFATMAFSCSYGDGCGMLYVKGGESAGD